MLAAKNSDSVIRQSKLSKMSSLKIFTAFTSLCEKSECLYIFAIIVIIVVLSLTFIVRPALFLAIAMKNIVRSVNAIIEPIIAKREFRTFCSE